MTGEMNIRIEHLLHHKRHIPTIAAWQQEEFGYLSPRAPWRSGSSD